MTRILVTKYVEEFPEGSRAILKSIMSKRAEEVYDVDRLFSAYFIAEAALAASNKLLSAIDEARRDRLLYRQFQVVYDEVSWGPVEVARTIAVYPAGLHASMTYVPAFSSPELLLLGEIVSRSLETLDEVKGYVDKTFNETKGSTQAAKGAGPLGGPDEDVSEGPVLERLDEVMDELERAVDRLKAEAEGLEKYQVPLSDEELRAEWEKLSPYAPRWLSEAWNAYSWLEQLRKGIWVTQPPFRGGRYLLVMLAWRLYELYVAGIVLEALGELGYSVEKADANRFVLTRDNEAIELLLNSDMEGSRLLSVDSDKETARKARGRPDISLKDKNRERLLVIECKFSDDPNYLTAGRFKAMAYLYEYGAQLGALVFPELNSERRPYDGEDEGTRGLWRSLTKEGGLLCMSLRDGTGQALYLLRVDPAEGNDAEAAWREAKRRVRKVLEGFLGPESKPCRSQTAFERTLGLIS
ncbi:MAG: hypothetical protein RXP86_06545 [Acidilobus sp.]